eukprot:m.133955 g.133955  ORF g.133955 m.133955 type:complete len:370 (-) comp17551_c0_seq13:623-1732(-)
MKLTDIRLLLVTFIAQVCLSLTPIADWCGPSVAYVQAKALLFSGVLLMIGLIVLVAFYKHTAAVVGNRVPKLQWAPLYNYFFIAKPLELLWRFATSPLRCLPDVLVVGEVRCGTTTLSEHLKSLPGVYGPFCPFVHPLDGKESFYFAGTYFGCVHPYLYRAVFPFKITKWFYEHVLGQPFLVMDACAQYLTSPIAPALMRKALGARDISIFVCLRDPVDQNRSWWQFEQASMAWFDSMGLSRSTTGECAPSHDLPKTNVRKKQPKTEVKEPKREVSRKGQDETCSLLPRIYYSVSACSVKKCTSWYHPNIPHVVVWGRTRALLSGWGCRRAEIWASMMLAVSVFELCVKPTPSSSVDECSMYNDHEICM